MIGAAPAVQGKAMITSASGEGFVQVKGIDPRSRAASPTSRKVLTDGSLDQLTPKSDDEFPGIVIGKDLAGSLGAMPGDMVTLLTPNGSLTPMGVMPRQRRFKVVGTFRLGLYEVDMSTGFVSLDSGMLIAGSDKVEHIELKVADVYDAPRIADQIAVDFGTEYVTQTGAT